MNSRSERQAVVLLEWGRYLITQPERWCRNAFARTTDGRPVSLTNPEAYAFCSMGALNYCAQYVPAEVVLTAKRYLYQSLWQQTGPESSVCRFNDTRQHDEVLALWDRAITLAKKAWQEAQEQESARETVAAGAD